MENAVKALYIAAGVLIVVMVLSLAAVLYASLQNYVEESNTQVKYNDINSFNSKYLNYINYSNGVKQSDLTIQDVVTVANMAYENNQANEIDSNQWNASSNSLYVQVILNGTRIDQTINDNIADLLESNKDKQYKCTPSDVLISETTGQVYSISFNTIN